MSRLVCGASQPEREEEKEVIKSAYEMLTGEDKMGSSFKFLAVFPATMKAIHEKYPPVGFSTSSSIASSK